MTKEEVQNKVDELWARIEECDITIDRLHSYGASWALDCREMRIAEANRAEAYAEIARLHAQYPWQT